MLRDEAAAMGLPMRMVVLTIVGMAGLAAMIMFISDMNIVPKSMHANIVGIDNSSISSVIYTDGSIRNITVEVIDVDGAPVEGATVIIFGLQTCASGLSDKDGYTSLIINTSTISVTGEGYLKLCARAEMFADYQNDYAIKVVGN
jgi:hypothetical protein